MKKILISLLTIFLISSSYSVVKAQDNEEIFYQNAIQNYKTGNILEAKTNIWKAISINRQEINYHILLAMIHQKNGEYAQAERVLMMAKILAPDNLRVYEFLGHNEFYQGKFESAINYYTYAKKLKSATPQDKKRLDDYIIDTRNTKK